MVKNWVVFCVNDCPFTLLTPMPLVAMRLLVNVTTLVNCAATTTMSQAFVGKIYTSPPVAPAERKVLVLILVTGGLPTGA